MEEVDWSSLHKILSDPTRRSILELLAEKEELSYMEIMVFLRITNTGRLNYHLKALSALVSKDEQGRYSLTEKGKLAANMLKTFPERAPVERKRLSALKIVAAVLLILLGVALILSAVGFAFFAVSSPAGVVSTETSGLGSRIIPQNTTIFLTSQIVQNDSKLDIDWVASSSIYLYVLNSTQYDALLLKNASGSEIPTYIENFTGMPSSYASRYDLQSGSISLALSEGQYYFFAGSANNAILDSLTLTTQQYQETGSSSIIYYLIPAVLGVTGTIMIALAALILNHRLWR